MRNRKNKKHNYKLDYISYWQTKGEYGKTRLERTLARKNKRLERLLHNCPRCRREKKESYHTCPYQCDMNGDYEYQCTCCDSCYNSCLGDI